MTPGSPSDRARTGHAVRPDRGHGVALLLVIAHLDFGGQASNRRELRVSAEASEMVSIPRAELDALKAELRGLRREVGRGVARTRIQADPGPGDDAPTLTGASLLKRGELVSNHLIRFPGTSWQEIEALPSIMGMPERLTCGTPAWARPLAVVCRRAGMMADAGRIRLARR